ncbi:hypothetical protein JMM59_04520 [Rhodovulum sulfidophilum]|uniref:hypothetical protein n=1 Tax=Rhodovulum sulfidophilum TaxID=35806 RepID=UPI0019222CF8|nr:hypothetical protein [Rhodovulum sulfidophilum]MBL3564276.1 hypothetical protein [Rhodovulum sulfidophilum]
MTPPKAPRTVRVVQRPAVGWFSLRLMLRAGVKALVSALAGTRTARREVLAALDLVRQHGHAGGRIRPAAAEPGQDGAIWVDYVADLGDGFAATHSIAWLVGRDYLGLGAPGQVVAQPVPDDATHEVGKGDFPAGLTLLPAGQITVFGGDQVYPYATQSDYADRCTGVYYAARPWDRHPDRPAGRRLYTIPGNHDWYDGLSAYVQSFCQPGRWHGAWQVEQARSYFALDLPHGVSIWGLDLAIENDFDAPQLDYFTERAGRLKDGDTVILCVPTPAWIKRDARLAPADAGAATWDAWSKIEMIQQLVKHRDGGAQVRAVISGDLHHYARYHAGRDGERNSCQYITCGGGGAFMLGTNSVPDEVRVLDGKTATMAATFPSCAVSRAIRNGVYKLVYRHKLFCLALAVVLFGLVWVFQAASYVMKATGSSGAMGPVWTGDTALDMLQSTIRNWVGLIDFWHVLLKSMIHNPLLSLITVGIAAGFIAFAASGRSIYSQNWAVPVAGFAHFMVQICVAFLIAAVIRAVLGPLQDWILVYITLMIALCLFFGWMVCGTLFALYLRIANATTGLHEQELCSSQAIEDWKCFLRIKVAADGLTIHPIGLRHAVRDWRSAPGTQAPKTTGARGLMQALRVSANDFEVPDGTTHLLDPVAPLAPQLIEAPIFIPTIRGGRL